MKKACIISLKILDKQIVKKTSTDPSLYLEKLF